MDNIDRVIYTIIKVAREEKTIEGLNALQKLLEELKKDELKSYERLNNKTI